MDSPRTSTIEEVLDDLVQKPTLKLMLTFLVLASHAMFIDSLAVMTVFTGHIPYNSWRCTSQYCLDLYQEGGYSTDFISEDTLCNNILNFTEGVDFQWEMDGRTSFAVEQGMFCMGETKLSSVGSIFFIGGILGGVFAGMCDKYGRKMPTIASGLITLLATVLGAFFPNFWVLLSLRFFVGLGIAMSSIGLFAWLLEFVPSRYRASFNVVIISYIPGFGYVLLDLIAYYVKNWQHIHLVMGLVILLTLIPLPFLPESPRYLLTKGRTEEATRVIQRYAVFMNSKLADNLDGLKLKNVENAPKTTLLDNLKAFKNSPILQLDLLLLTVTWFIAQLLLWGFHFGYSKMAPNFYISYIFAALGVALPATIIVPINNCLGRKGNMLFHLVGQGLCSCVAMINLTIFGTWTVRQIAVLIGSFLISNANTAMYLYVAEVSPTTHRTGIMSFCYAIARTGAVAGTYLPIMFTLVGDRATLGLFIGLVVVALVAVMWATDPTGRPIPETLEDLKKNVLEEEEKTWLLKKIEDTSS